MKFQTEMPDEKLLQFYLGSNPAALATLTDLYKDRIYNVICASVKDRYAAEIIFRDVFVRIINNMMAGKNPDDMPFLQWSMDVAQQLCLEYSYKVRQPVAQEMHCEETTALAEIHEKLPFKTYYESHTKLRSVIYMLPDGQREVMILNHYAGVRFRDIATKRKCSVTGALDLMKLALINLRKLMTEEDVILA